MIKVANTHVGRWFHREKSSYKTKHAREVEQLGVDFPGLLGFIRVMRCARGVKPRRVYSVWRSGEHCQMPMSL